jgi:4-amino-4-deoxy-L-arabinose transferase-like glycosyltransferase
VSFRGSRGWIVGLAAILALAAFLRLWRLPELPPPLFHDEAVNRLDALDAWQTRQFEVFYPENNGREGLYINIGALSLACFGDHDWALRLPSVLFGLLTVAGLALLGAELAGPRVGLLAAFFLATSFWHMLLSREAFRAIAGPCFLTWALYLMLAARRRPMLWPIAGVVYGLGFHTYIAYRATPLLIAPLLWRVGWKRVVAFVAAAAVVIAPLALYFIQHPGSFLGRTAQVAVWTSRTIPEAALEFARNIWRVGRMFFTHGDYNWRHNFPFRAELYWPVAVCLVLGLIAPHKRPAKLLALGWLVVAAIPVVLSAENPHALRAVLLLPAVLLLAALGADALYSRLPERVAPFAAVLFLAWLAWEPYDAYFHRWALDPRMPAGYASLSGINLSQ